MYSLDSPIKARLFIDTVSARGDLACYSGKHSRLRVSISLDSRLGPAINLGSCDFGQAIHLSGPQLPQM